MMKALEKLPKLKARGLRWDVSKEIRDFEQAKYLPFDNSLMIIVVDDRLSGVTKISFN